MSEPKNEGRRVGVTRRGAFEFEEELAGEATGTMIEAVAPVGEFGGRRGETAKAIGAVELARDMIASSCSRTRAFSSDSETGCSAGAAGAGEET